MTVDGIPVTSAARSVADAAEAGTGPEQIVMAVAQALERGLAMPEELRGQAGTHSGRVCDLIDRAIGSAQHAAGRPTERVPA